MDLARTYQSDNDQVIICAEFCPRYFSSIQPEYDSDCRNDHQYGDGSDQFAATTFGETGYRSEAEVFRSGEGF